MADGATGGAPAATAQASTAQAVDAGAQVTQGEAQAQPQETKPSGRDRILERFKKSHPDYSFDEASGESGINGLFDLIADEFDKWDEETRKRNERDEQMNKLFKEQPESADLFRRWAKGEGNPFDDIVDNYADILEDGIQSEAGKERLKKAREERAKREADNKAADEAYEKNIGETFSKALREFADENKLTDEQAAEVFLEARDRVNNAIDGIYGKDFFQMIHDGKRYREDVARAREEGEVNGRNAKIKAELRKSKSARSGAPALGGAGLASEEVQEEKKPDILPMFGIPIRKKNSN